jgi:hypothetical protein
MLTSEDSSEVAFLLVGSYDHEGTCVFTAIGVTQKNGKRNAMEGDECIPRGQP